MTEQKKKRWKRGLWVLCRRAPMVLYASPPRFETEWKTTTNAKRQVFHFCTLFINLASYQLDNPVFTRMIRLQGRGSKCAVCLEMLLKTHFTGDVSVHTAVLPLDCIHQHAFKMHWRGSMCVLSLSFFGSVSHGRSLRSCCSLVRKPSPWGGEDNWR